MRHLVKLMLTVALLPCAARMGFSRGDKIVPQVVDGQMGDGTTWSTKFDLTNVATRIPGSDPQQDPRDIANMRIAFYNNDGTPWILQTSLGTGSSFPLPVIKPRETIRLETQGTGGINSGYAVILDEEPQNSPYSEDYALGISLFYVVSSSTGIADTVTVSVPQPTQAATVPLELDDSKGIYSGLALVNTADVTNSLQVDFYKSDGSFYATKTITLSSTKMEWAGYLDNPDLFQGLKSFKGMAEISSLDFSPFVLLGLLQTRAADGKPQYATLVPVDKEALRRNTYMVLLQASTDDRPFMPIDLDNFTVDYFRTAGEFDSQNFPLSKESYPWDFEYRYDAPNTSSRYLQAFNGAVLAPFGINDADQFDGISLADLKKQVKDNATSTIEVSDSRGLLVNQGFAFAVRTDVGNYAKVRIVRIIDTEDNLVTPIHYNKDLVLEVCIYK